MVLGLARTVALFSVFVALPGLLSLAFAGDFEVALVWVLAGDLAAGVATGVGARSALPRSLPVRDAAVVLGIQLIMGYLCLAVSAITTTDPGAAGWLMPLPVTLLGGCALVVGFGIGVLAGRLSSPRREAERRPSERRALARFVASVVVFAASMTTVGIAGSLAFYDLDMIPYGTRALYQLIVVLTAIPSDSIVIGHDSAAWTARAALAVAILCAIVAAHSAAARWGSRPVRQVRA